MLNKKTGLFCNPSLSNYLLDARVLREMDVINFKGDLLFHNTTPIISRIALFCLRFMAISSDCVYWRFCSSSGEILFTI